MALLDLQGMEYQGEHDDHRDSDLSVIACTVRGGSSLSITLCDVD